MLLRAETGYELRIFVLKAIIHIKDLFESKRTNLEAQNDKIMQTIKKLIITETLNKIQKPRFILILLYNKMLYFYVI